MAEVAFALRTCIHEVGNKLEYGGRGGPFHSANLSISQLDVTYLSISISISTCMMKSRSRAGVKVL